MKRDDVTRRDFNQLTMAAFGGVMAGSLVGCGGGKDKDKDKDGGKAKDGAPKDGTSKDGAAKDKDAAVAANDWTGDVHVCRGLNACKGKGAGGENDCAGMGACATAASHSCHKENDCKYQGGCGKSVGQNACKGQGECAVPLGEKAWTTARASFEAAMTSAGKKFGDAPAKADDKS